jgi:predicted XRE-type DNA-binding protein
MADSVFYDLAETPEEAANLTARGMLMIAIEQRIKEEGWTQTEAAARLHVTQPRVSDLLNGKISKFSLDALVNMLPSVGLTVDVRPVERRPARAAKKAKAAQAHRPAKPALGKRKALSGH